MAYYSPFLRPLGIAAGGLGTFQAIIWGTLSLLGILLYNGDIEMKESQRDSKKFEIALAFMYFERTPKPFDHMTPETVVFWTSAYFAASVIWLVISCILLYDSCKSRFTSKVLIGWVAVSAVVAAIDLAGFVAFCVDYNKLQKRLDDRSNPISYGAEYLSVPLFMMIMCARGFIFWIINVGLAIYLGVAERKLYKEVSQDLLQTVSRSQDRLNPAFQPYSIYQHRKSSRLHDVMNPIPSIPRVGYNLPDPARERSFRMQRNSRTVSYF